MEDKDPIIVGLQKEIDALDQRREALCSAVAALTGTAPANGPVSTKKRPVGDDKVEKVRKFIRDRGRVRQAEITQALGFNSGTTYEATAELERLGEVERGPKEDRSVTWTYVG